MTLQPPPEKPTHFCYNPQSSSADISLENVIPAVFQGSDAMNGRLVTLLAVSGLFIAIWNTDEQGNRNIPLKSARLTLTPARCTPSKSKNRWTEATCPIPLPPGMASGTYRVVNNAGAVGIVEVGHQPPGGPKAVPSTVSCDLYTVTEGTCRWYLIRMDLESADRVAEVIPAVRG